MEITPFIIGDIWKVAELEAPHEACGYLWTVEPGIFSVACRTMNLAQDTTKEFWLHPHEFSAYRDIFVVNGMMLAIWHSHPYGRWDLSRADRQLMVETQVPMVVVAWKPWPSVSLYELQEGQIRKSVSYEVEGVRV